MTVIPEVRGAARRPGRPRDPSVDDTMLAAAIEELADRGFATFSVESVAARAQMSKATIYRRYPTREQFIAGALDRLNAESLRPLRGGTARERLLELLTSIRENQPASDVARILRHAAAFSASHDELAAMVDRLLIEPRRNRIHACIAEAIAEREIRDDIDVSAVSVLLVGAVVQLGAWQRDPSESGNLDVSTLLDLAMTGIAAR